ncbi:MAG TPA: kelch repeat-containing protein [Terriglobales bacterium]|nr:kelch repeat-containing protein [Terriglobales bacterium]
MRKLGLMVVAVAGLGTVLAQENLEPLPVPLTNNAVVAVKVSGQTLVYSFMGLDASKKPDAVKNSAYALNLKYNKWTTIRSVQGSGRLGAGAAAVAEEVFVIGGFVPDRSGLQAIVADVSVYSPLALRWYRGPDLLTPVRDAMAAEYRDRYVYVVGGFSKSGPTNDVQLYDTATKEWSKATPYPGPAVFGHSGTIVGDTIVYVDGAKASGGTTGPRYVASDECWMGKIDRKDPKKITWSKLPAHPGKARYRIAAGGAEKEGKAYFAGGSDIVYDYTGIGFDGAGAEPSPVVFDYNVKRDAWETILVNDPNPTMDHHGMAVTSDGLITVGGMAKGQKVTGAVRVLPRGK